MSDYLILDGPQLTKLPGHQIKIGMVYCLKISTMGPTRSQSQVEYFSPIYFGRGFAAQIRDRSITLCPDSAVSFPLMSDHYNSTFEIVI